MKVMQINKGKCKSYSKGMSYAGNLKRVYYGGFVER